MSGHRGLRLKLVERWATLESEGEQLGEHHPPSHPTEEGQYRF